MKPKQILKDRAEGKTGRGRFKIEWEDGMGRIMGRTGKRLQEIKRIARDRDKFRR